MKVSTSAMLRISEHRRRSKQTSLKRCTANQGDVLIVVRGIDLAAFVSQCDHPGRCRNQSGMMAIAPSTDGSMLDLSCWTCVRHLERQIAIRQVVDGWHEPSNSTAEDDEEATRVPCRPSTSNAASPPSSNPSSSRRPACAPTSPNSTPSSPPCNPAPSEGTSERHGDLRQLRLPEAGVPARGGERELCGAAHLSATRGPPASMPGTRWSAWSCASTGYDKTLSPPKVQNLDSYLHRARLPRPGARGRLAEGGVHPAGGQRGGARQEDARRQRRRWRWCRSCYHVLLLGGPHLPAEGRGEPAGRRPSTSRSFRRSELPTSPASRRGAGGPRRARAGCGRRTAAQGTRGRTASPARAARGHQGRERGSPRHARLERGQDPQAPHRPRPAARRLAAGSGPRPGIRSHRHAQQEGHRLRRLRPVGRRRQAAGGGRGEEDHRRSGGGAAAGEALRRLPGGDARPASDHLLHQRLQDLDVGRPGLPAAPGGRVLQEGRAGLPDPSPHAAASRWTWPR